MLRLIAITTFSINLRFKAKQSKANVILQIRSVLDCFQNAPQSPKWNEQSVS